MGIFDKIFGSDNKTPKEEPKALPWQELKEVSKLDEMMVASKERMQVIFKHSTRCGISKMVLRNFERSFDLEHESLDLFYLDLLNYRPISSEIANKFQVFHESPQMIVLKNGSVVHHSSHSTITPQVLHQFV